MREIPSCSFPPRDLASKEPAENWPELISCFCTGSACDNLVTVPSLVPGFIVWGQKILFLFISIYQEKKKIKAARTHTCHSSNRMLNMPVISSESTPTHKHPTQYMGGRGEKATKHFELQPTAESGFVWSGKAKAVAERGEEEPEGGSWPPPRSFDPGAMLAAGQSPLWAVLICAGHGCLPGGLVAAGDYWGQGHPPFSLPRIVCSDGQGKGWGRNRRRLIAGGYTHSGDPQRIPCCLPACCKSWAHMSHLTPKVRQFPAKLGVYDGWSRKLHFQYPCLIPNLFKYIYAYINKMHFNIYLR